MGDVVHTLPALTDAMNAIPNIVFDWVVEERFKAIPAWHPAVDRVIPIKLRQWKKNKIINPLQIFSILKSFKKILNQKAYDLLIDPQGLLKSAFITYLVKAPSVGYQSDSIREKLAAYFYNKNYAVSWGLHAVERIRQLFSQALYYPVPKTMADYGVDKTQWLQVQQEPYVLFFHGTTWANKHWPENYWKMLTQLLNKKNMKVKLSWGSQEEYERSIRIAEKNNAEVLPDLDINGLVPAIANASAVVAVDTGLCHLAAAFNVPTVALFGPTDPEKTGVMGKKQVNLAANFPCAPCLKRECSYKEIAQEWPACFVTLPPHLVLDQLIKMNIGKD